MTILHTVILVVRLVWSKHVYFYLMCKHICLPHVPLPCRLHTVFQVHLCVYVMYVHVAWSLISHIFCIIFMLSTLAALCLIHCAFVPAESFLVCVCTYVYACFSTVLCVYIFCVPSAVLIFPSFPPSFSPLLPLFYCCRLAYQMRLVLQARWQKRTE